MNRKDNENDIQTSGVFVDYFELDLYQKPILQILHAADDWHLSILQNRSCKQLLVLPKYIFSCLLQ